MPPPTVKRLSTACARFSKVRPPDDGRCNAPPADVLRYRTAPVRSFAVGLPFLIMSSAFPASLCLPLLAQAAVS